MSTIMCYFDNKLQLEKKMKFKVSVEYESELKIAKKPKGNFKYRKFCQIPK
jgi:hypothetical protein